MNSIRSKAVLFTPANCPIGPDVTTIVDSSAALSRALRKLRHDLDYCTTCPNGPKCSAWTEYQATVNKAINTVAREWRP
jgi:hypothetical protein